MLRKYYLLLVFAFPFFAYSQTTVPFPSQDATWLYGLYDDFGNQYGSYLFYLDGDSSYMGETWPVLYQDGQYYGMIRQDSTLKVWIIPSGLTTPELLYDFGTAVGDTIRGIRTQFITTLDTVVVENISMWGGSYPNEWYLRSIGSQASGFHYQWNEGIGDQSWLPASSPIDLVSGTTYLNCFSGLSYTTPGNPCIVSSDEALSQRLKVHPNPSNGKYRLEFDNPAELAAMQVMDIHGRVVKAYDEFTDSIDLTGLKAGIYFLTVQSGDHLLSRKLILQ